MSEKNYEALIDRVMTMCCLFNHVLMADIVSSIQVCEAYK